MARWLRSIASLLAVVTIAGTPAVLSACVALCLPGMEAHHRAAMVETSAPACAEHEAAAVPVQSDAQVTRTGEHCCADGLTAPAASIIASRADMHRLVAALVSSRASWPPAVLPGSPAPPRRLSAPPPSPPHRPSVLRI